MKVNVFSRTTIKQQQIVVNQYYICINSSGGDHSDIIFNDSEYVRNFWFDDSLMTEVKWGADINSMYLSVAITFEQAFELYNFITSMPEDSTVNIYCSKGKSRSAAVAEFLKREYSAVVTSENELTPNERVLNFLYNAKYKFIQPINFNFSYDKLVEYYREVESKFQDLKWTADRASDTEDSEKHRIDGFVGWAIQSNLENLEEPCPPYHVHTQGSNTYKNTRLVFGFTEKLLERFPYGRQLGIAVHPQGVSIGQHTDNVEFVKIHFPIISNSKSYFVFGEYRYILEAGRAYLLDTRYMHGTDNQGDVDRVHLLLKLPVDMMDDALK